MTKIKSRFLVAFTLLATSTLIITYPIPDVTSLAYQSAYRSAQRPYKRLWAHPHPLDFLAAEKLKARWHQQQLNEKGMAASTQATNTDIGDIALIEDDGSIVIQPNTFDLSRKNIVFTPSPTGGFVVSTAPFAFANSYGTKINNFTGSFAPSDDGYQQVNFTSGFTFTYFGATYTEVFVGTNGFLTFGSGDADLPPHESLLDFLRMQPRIAVFWHDLDPGQAQPSDGLFIHQFPDRFVVTWDRVPEYTPGSARHFNTFQITLYADGKITFSYDKIESKTALVGLSPGGSAADANSIDLSKPPTANLKGAVFEFFSASRQIDFFALGQAFFKTRPDTFDFIYLWTDFDFAIDGQNAFAAFLLLQNDAHGIGLTIFNESNLTGSNGKLQGMLVMGNIDKSYPDAPTKPISNSTYDALGVMGQENGHRWLSYVSFEDGDKISTAILGRDNDHWSFFLNTESTVSTPTNPRSSTMEGNAWLQTAERNFSTPKEERSEGYSALDLYLMGLRSPDEVPDFFLIENPAPANWQAKVLAALNLFDSTMLPLPNIGVRGDKKIISLKDIIAAEGPRVPDATLSQKEFLGAFVLLVQSGTQPSAETLNKLNLYRASWEQYFQRATGGRGRIRTSLRD